MNTKEGLAVVLADVSGKGVSAALLASTLQGMIYSHLIAGMSLLEVVTAVNRFFTEKMGGEKYATVLLVRLRAMANSNMSTAATCRRCWCAPER